MQRPSGASQPLWMRDVEVHPTKLLLTPRSTADVCIVGGGITGLTTAYLLAREGKRVVVLESRELGSGETGRTTAHLSSALDDRFEHLEKLHGAQGARLAAASHSQAIDTIEAIVRTENIDCGFERVDGYLFMGPKDTRETLEREATAASRAGLLVELLENPVGPALAAGPCLRFSNQAQFHPLRYLEGLVRAIERMGGAIFEHAHVEKFESSSPTRVTVSNGQVVEATWLVVATNTPVNDRFVVHTKQVPYRSYAIGLSIPEGAVPTALYWDNDDPYHYVRVDPTKRADGTVTLIVGGSDHRTGEEADAAPWEHLETWARQHFEAAGEVVDRWSGQVLEPTDSLAFIGRNPADGPHVLIATGDSGHGLTHGTIAATMFSDFVAERSNPYETLYDPRRISLRAATEFAKNGLATAKHYSEWARPADVKSEDEIERGEGATLRMRGQHLAVYRDDRGICHRFSVACPHLGAVLHWNPVEKSWDCPAHGTRFDAEGKVICGPSTQDMTKVDQLAPAVVLVKDSIA